MSWFEIFRAGTWNGGKWDELAEKFVPYSEADLDMMVANFEKGTREVPLILGHNTWSDEKPALGWVGEVKREGDRLLARAKEISAELKEAVNTRKFPKRSVELYDNIDGQGCTLAAVAFLGGSQPAVPGMPDVSFAAWPDGKRLFTADYSQSQSFDAKAQRGEEAQSEEHGKNGKHGSDGSDGENDEDDLQNEKGGGTRMKLEEQLTAMQAENADLKAKVAKAAEEKAALEKKAREDGVRRYLAAKVKAKQLTPAMVEGDGSKKPGLSAFMLELDDAQVEALKGFLDSALENVGKALEALDSESAADDGESDSGDGEGEAGSFAAKFNLDKKTLAREIAQQK